MNSQNQEEKFIAEYFKLFTGSLLDIGANDGKTYSNSIKLMYQGWMGLFIEPSPEAFSKLADLYKFNSLAYCLNVAIGETDGEITLHESGYHLPDKSDYGLLSTIKESEKVRWKEVAFKEVKVKCLTFKSLMEKVGNGFFDFITIDAEGMDLEILKQIDLTFTNLLCIEHNGESKLKLEIISYCKQYGMEKIIYQSPENILIAK